MMPRKSKSKRSKGSGGGAGRKKSGLWRRGQKAN